MKRYIVLSVNDDPVYLFYLPLALWAWRKIGWLPITAFIGNMYSPVSEFVLNQCKGGPFINFDKIDGYRDDTITQVSRLYCATFAEDESMVMTGDIDLIPLSDYWNPHLQEITCYGLDLADYRHYPICFVAMSKENWNRIMRLSENTHAMKNDLDSMPQAKDPDFYKYWFTDQDLITNRLKGKPINSILRGKLPNGLAKGRVDRGSWSLNHETFIDAHLHRDLYKAFQNPGHEHFQLYQKKWREHMELLHTVWPNEDWTWFIDYTKQFAELAK